MNLDSGNRPTPAYSNGVRRHPRVMFSVPILLHRLSAGGLKTTRGITLDLSQGGIGALVQGSLSIGETVQIDLPVATCMLGTVAIVRHTTSAVSGFEFLGLTDDEHTRLAAAINKALSEGTGLPS
ncbi:MAG TPA: PilZ domain-containing protein [Terriglobales bacterium]|nr:PilZ domain-containing protein [Terriglobales bacterium]